MSSMVGLDVLYKIYSPDIFIIEACKGSNNYTETWSHATTHKFLPTGPQLLFFTLNDIFWLGAVLSWLSPISIYNCTTKHSVHSETLGRPSRHWFSSMIFCYYLTIMSRSFCIFLNCCSAEAPIKHKKIIILNDVHLVLHCSLTGEHRVEHSCLASKDRLVNNQPQSLSKWSIDKKDSVMSPRRVSRKDRW